MAKKRSEALEAIAETQKDMYECFVQHLCRNKYISNLQELESLIKELNKLRQSHVIGFTDQLVNGKLWDKSAVETFLYKTIYSPRINLNINWSNIIPNLFKNGTLFGKSNLIDYSPEEYLIFDFLSDYCFYNKKYKLIDITVLESIQSILNELDSFSKFYSDEGYNDWIYVKNMNRYIYNFVRLQDSLYASAILDGKGLLDKSFFKDIMSSGIEIVETIRKIQRNLEELFGINNTIIYSDDIYQSYKKIDSKIETDKRDCHKKTDNKLTVVGYGIIRDQIQPELKKLYNLYIIHAKFLNKIFNYILSYNLGKIAKIKLEVLTQ